MGGFIFQQGDKYEAARERMVTQQIVSRGVKDAATLKAMRMVPRHIFVPKEYENEAYDDNPLPIGYGQTISQPYIVAYMTEIAGPDPSKKALEIGTGSGYQAAILGEVVKKVYSIEIVPELARESAERLKKLGYTNITVKYGDGYKGWKEYSPFDIIIVTAAAEEIPKPLIDQLAENGRLVIPVGPPAAVQELILLEKKNGKIEKSRLTFVRFVPFKRL
ncbi:MAG: protein-L-isoaspartate O-methyltransferase [Bacteroidetes bacterium RBG_19FT_COMBO_42_7]|jgi:protein-L-isoaspartate(D-aspartate) O-methyltransferase|nr:MAG: protein-L-isoaspartate O-methyltransferase [Bacteroidetes bacterium RBG_13_42_15]OFY74163.1 MAG: protein-L-isoaspartate O-methyltransferase [Bacteroidetes bacterium RBG_19FT_COMBO_42_7]